MDIFEASLKRKNLKKAPVEWESTEYKLGETDNGFYTRVQASIPLLTVEFPNPVVFLTLSNKQHIFVRTHPVDLRGMAVWLMETADEIDKQAESLELKQQTMIQMQTLSHEGGTFDNPDILAAAIQNFNKNMKLGLGTLFNSPADPPDENGDSTPKDVEELLNSEVQSKKGTKSKD